LTPENELLAEYVGHLERSPLTGRSPRGYLGAIRQSAYSLPADPVSGGPAAVKACWGLQSVDHVARLSWQCIVGSER
jgi:hypothetical protein